MYTRFARFYTTKDLVETAFKIDLGFKLVSMCLNYPVSHEIMVNTGKLKENNPLCD
jgi:hypothetical protein